MFFKQFNACFGPGCISLYQKLCMYINGTLLNIQKSLRAETASASMTSVCHEPQNLTLLQLQPLFEAEQVILDSYFFLTHSSEGK